MMQEQKLKLMTIVGTRPEIIKLSEIIKLCEECFAHTLVHSGQNYDYTLNTIFFEQLGLKKPDVFLNIAASSLGESIANIIARSYALLSETRPDAVLILGDTNSALSAICAKRLKIPVFHLEAGNRCFDENLPEEINRRIVDHIADVNLAYSEFARRNLLDEGLSQAFTFVVGSPMAEILKVNKDKIENSDVLSKLGLAKQRYIVLSAHREENIDDEKHFFMLFSAINKLAETYDMPVVYSMHPRSRKMVGKRGFHFDRRVRIMEPFGFFDYCCLQKNAFCVVSDSGTLAEESALLGFPCVSVRTSTERQEAVEKGNLIMAGITTSEVLEGVRLAVELAEANKTGSFVSDYGDETVSVKVVKIIQSYTQRINQMVWRKEI